MAKYIKWYYDGYENPVVLERVKAPDGWEQKDVDDAIRNFGQEDRALIQWAVYLNEGDHVIVQEASAIEHYLFEIFCAMSIDEINTALADAAEDSDVSAEDFTKLYADVLSFIRPTREKVYA